MSPPTFALVDRALCLAPELFRSLPRGSRGAPLSIRYEHGEATSLDFSAPVALGCDDMRTYLGVAALASRARLVVTPDSSAPYLPLRSALGAQGFDADDELLLVSCSMSELAEAIGYRSDGGGALRRKVRESLDRLAGLRVAVTSGEGRSSSRLLAWDLHGGARDGLRVVLSARSTKCVKVERQFARIDMSEARGLSSDPARKLHFQLSAWVDADGVERRMAHDVLISYVWGSSGSSAPSDVLRQRRASLRNALGELQAVGWHVTRHPSVPNSVGITRRPWR